MNASVLMFQGTGSDVGKSTLVAGLCRIAHRRGINVAPFKPQNMSNNAAPCPGGGEIGRAQALQARAAGLESCVDFNPVLLKPQSDCSAQVVLHGKVLHTLSAAGKVEGTYLHGLFTNDQFRSWWLNSVRAGSSSQFNYDRFVEKELDNLADGIEKSLDVDALFADAKRAVI